MKKNKEFAKQFGDYLREDLIRLTAYQQMPYFPGRLEMYLARSKLAMLKYPLVAKLEADRILKSPPPK